MQTTITYDDVYDVDTVTDPAGNVIDIDSIPSQVTGLTFSDAQERRDVYGNISYATRDDDFYNTLSLTDAAGNTWTYGYVESDDASNYGTLESVTPPGGQPTDYTINGDTGELTQVTNPNDLVENRSYYLEQLTDYYDYNSTDSVEFHDESAYYNYSNGNISELDQVISGGIYAIISYTYTDSEDVASDNPSLGVPLGLIKRVTDPDANKTDYTYNSQGLVSSITSGVGTVDQTKTQYFYDPNDNLSYTIEAGTAKTKRIMSTTI